MPLIISSRGGVWSRPTLASWASSYSMSLRSCLPRPPPRLPPAKERPTALRSSPTCRPWALTCRLPTAHSLPRCWPRCPPTRQPQSSAGAPWPQPHPAKPKLGEPAQPQEQLWFCILTRGHFIPVQYWRPHPVLLSWWDSEGVTRFADKLPTDLGTEGRPSHYESTVRADYWTSRPLPSGLPNLCTSKFAFSFQA